MQPIIRYPGMVYADEYKKLTHETYAGVNTVIFGTYYQLDNEQTTYDPNYEQTYREQGDLSGRKFNKIHNVPMMLVKDATPINLDASEKGVNFMNEPRTSIVLDPIMGLDPHVGDYVTFNISGDDEEWKVIHFSKSGTFDHTYHQCDIQPCDFRREFEDVNVFEEFIYIEYPKKIYYLQDGENYAKTLNRLSKIISFLNDEDNYNYNLGYHVSKETNCFPQLETLLAAHKQVAPPTTIYLGETYDVDIPVGSLLMLWCMTSMFDSKATYMDRVVATSKATMINERLTIWNKYTEWVMDSTGSHSFSAFFYDDSTDFSNATTYIRNSLSKGKYEEYSDDNNSAIGQLANEVVKFYYEGIESYPEKCICTNLFEAVVEYCQVLKEMAQLVESAVRLT